MQERKAVFQFKEKTYSIPSDLRYLLNIFIWGN
ncbi:hypothetical protein P872_21395 [Rhodonellum psychrophilum GCM71 = DSM 17998]|uniref:Uncharacterized protein n=1 Tax=Rhodonellum psychrophilum GCM71 = DSM 17998 TaxID=1123057 RepID=U5BS17_9BACT|nr:hypothetical protein P872_21395 [Rhodonellum psychrophilum GCM71 = DSM 17998]